MEDGLGRRGNSLFYGAMLLTAGSLGLRLVQLAFQVYISGVMGAAGLGRMQLIMTVGGFAGILASGGVRIAVTYLAAQEAGRDHASGVRTAVGCCGLYGGILSLAVGTILFLLADRLASWWVEDASAALPLRIFAVFLPITVEWSVLAGYFTAAGRITELVGLEFFERLGSIALVVLGTCTAFCDLLVTPIITLGLPVAVWLCCLPQRAASGARQCLPVIGGSLCWGAGYAMCWGLKWVLATLITGQDIIGDAIHQAGVRTTWS